MLRAVSLLIVLSLAGCGGARAPGFGGRSGSVECVPFAREVSGIQLFGPAASWWTQAEGRYRRRQQPGDGGVLVFQPTARLPSGHVAVVLRSVSDRQITVTQANWVHGRIAAEEPVVDVSPSNDWTEVRVWWAPSGVLGTTVYPTYGFILPEGAAGG